MARLNSNPLRLLRADRDRCGRFLHDGCGIAGRPCRVNQHEPFLGIGGAADRFQSRRFWLAGRGRFSPVRSPGFSVSFSFSSRGSFIEEHRGGKEAFSKVKVDGTNLIKIGLMATIFLIIARYFFARYSVPGISDLIVGGT